MKTGLCLVAALAFQALWAAPTRTAGAEEPKVGVVSHVKVLSDKVPDVSSLEAWKAACIKDGMSDQEKALAIWRTVVGFRHQDAPPDEYLQGEGNVHDPIKSFNVYGYGMCCCASSNIEALARYLGLEARGWGIQGHSVPEVFYDGHWHMLDASLIGYFPKADGQIAGVEEICAGVRAWLADNPQYRGNDRKLREFMANGGWRKGPEVLAHCPTYDENGWWPAATHGWYSTMQEFAIEKPFTYEYGYSQGYQVNVQLRPGEVLTRNWSNKGLHVNMAEGKAPGCLTGAPGKGDLRYSPQYGDLAPGRIGNGTLTYEPTSDPCLAQDALAIGNLDLVPMVAGKAVPFALRAHGGDKPGGVEIRMPSSYVYLGGEMTLNLTLGEPLGSESALAVYLSDNNGLDWKLVALAKTAGKQKIDLKPFVFRRYDYRLRFVLGGNGTSIDSLRIVHDIQHSQRALPALAQGKNTLTFSAGPQEGTITVEGAVSAKEAKGKQLLHTDFHPVSAGLEGEGIRVGRTGTGSITFPIATPGDMTRLRFGCHYRARDAQDGWDMQVSFDGGKTFRTAARAAGPTPGMCKYVAVGDVPAGTKQAQVRFSGQQRNTACIFDFRIDADYQEPAGGFLPVRVTYVWEENGQEQRDTHLAGKPQDTYTIDCAVKPTMKSLVVELAN